MDLKNNTKLHNALLFMPTVPTFYELPEKKKHQIQKILESSNWDIIFSKEFQEYVRLMMRIDLSKIKAYPKR